jgi:hypothetical protein
MSEQSRQPLEETPEVAAAVEDDVAVPQFITGGGPDADTPEFLEPTAGSSAPEQAGDGPTAD